MECLPVLAVFALLFVAFMRVRKGSFNPVRWIYRSGYDLFPNRGGFRWMTHVLYGPIAFQAVRTGLELGVFDLLKQRPGLTQEAIGRALGVGNVHGLGIVLDACAAARGLHKRNGRFSVAYPGDLDMLKAHFRQANTLMYRQLFYTREAVEQGKPMGLYQVYGLNEGNFYEAKRDIPELDEAWTPVISGHSRRNRGRLLARFDYGPFRHVMDVGCNDAELLVQVAGRHPDLKGTVIDLPDSPGLERSRRNIEENGLSDRIEVVGLDAFESPLPRGADLIQFIHFMNMFSPERNRILLRKAWEALEPGGTVLVCGPVVREDRNGFLVEEPVLYSLVFLVCRTGEGRIYPEADLVAMVEDTGFVDVRARRLNVLEVIVIGRKPGV